MSAIPRAPFGWPDAPLAGRIWTSRYQNQQEIIASGLAPVRITLGAPRWLLPFRIAGTLRELMPPPETMRRPYLEPDDFREVYTAKLDAVGVDRIRRELDRIRDRAHADPVLLCFEDVSNGTQWCHRLVFGEWWQERTGEAVLELRR